ncbi:hypothetical protein BH11ARM1_BH11ARM1_06350 [soil metagenome]
MIEVPSAPEQIVMVGEFPLYSPAELFASFVTPEILQKWWPQLATVDPVVGGSYSFEWPDMNWKLSGKYTALESGEHLGFTWSWNHEPTDYPIYVDIYFEETDGGTRMSIFHHPFLAERPDDRQGVVEGWIHFGMKLAGLKRESSEDSDQP